MINISFGSGLIVVCVAYKWHNKTHHAVPLEEIKLFFIIHEYTKHYSAVKRDFN